MSNHLHTYLMTFYTDETGEEKLQEIYQAEDADHAIEQLENAHPTATLIEANNMGPYDPQ